MVEEIRNLDIVILQRSPDIMESPHPPDAVKDAVAKYWRNHDKAFGEDPHPFGNPAGMAVFEAEMVVDAEAADEVVHEITSKVEKWLSDPTTSVNDLKAGIDEIEGMLTKFDLPHPYDFVPGAGDAVSKAMYIDSFLHRKRWMLKDLEDKLEQQLRELQETCKKDPTDPRCGAKPKCGGPSQRLGWMPWEGPPTSTAAASCQGG